MPILRPALTAAALALIRQRRGARAGSRYALVGNGWLGGGPMSEESQVRSDHYDIYSGFSNNVRGWLVAYGIGFLVILLSQEHLRDTVVRSEEGSIIAALLLAGAISQLSASLLYKWTIGKLYLGDSERGAVSARHRNSRFHKFSLWLFDALWVEIAIDLATVLSYVIATYQTFQILAGTQS
jgi:hypothetical protein